MKSIDSLMVEYGGCQVQWTCAPGDRDHYLDLQVVIHRALYFLFTLFILSSGISVNREDMSYQLISSDLTRYKTFRNGCDKLIAVENIFIKQGDRILEICESIIQKPIVYWTVKERLESKYTDFGTSSVQIMNLSEYLRENLTQNNNDVEELQRLIENHAKFDKRNVRKSSTRHF